MMSGYFTFVLLFWVSKFLIISGQQQNLILVLVDGFANYYLDEKNVNLDGFKQIQQNGVRAKSLKPIFPSTSLPNHYTITTGKYADGHGIIGNEMFAPERKHYKYFKKMVLQSDNDLFWWNKTKPIWVTAQKEGLKVYGVYWRLCEVKYAGESGTMKRCISYNHNPTQTEKLNETFPNLISDIAKDRTNFALLFFKMVDANGHDYGPQSPQRIHSTEMISKYLLELQEGITRNGLWNNTNLVVVSDHGMTSGSKENKKCINVFEECIRDARMVRQVVVQESIFLVHANEGYEKQLYNHLKSCERNGVFKNVIVTWRKNFPERFHYKDAPYIPHIMLRATAYCLLKCNGTYCYPKQTEFHEGNHGWDNEYDHMQAIMVGRGPTFKKNYTANAIEMVDLYQLFCHILGIEMDHAPDGKWDRVTDLLLNNAKNNSSFRFLIFVCLFIWHQLSQ